MKNKREEEERGKRRYLERLIQEEEADQQIKNYKDELPTDDDPPTIPNNLR